MNVPKSAYFVQAYLLITNNMIAVSVKEYHTDKRVFFKICGNCSTEIVGESKKHPGVLNLAILDAFTALGFERSKSPIVGIMYHDIIMLSLEQYGQQYEKSNVVIL